MEREETRGPAPLVAWIGVLVTVGTLVGGLWQYQHTREQTFRQRFWEARYALYHEATEVAAHIAVADDLLSVEPQRQRFWQLYWGPLSMLEDPAVYDAMVAFGGKLSELEGRGRTDGELRQLSYALARACRTSLRATWEPVPLDELVAEKRDWGMGALKK